jgi:hypothetical protein
VKPWLTGSSRATPGTTTWRPPSPRRGSSGGERRTSGTRWRSATGSGSRSSGLRTRASTTSRRLPRLLTSTRLRRRSHGTSGGGPTSGLTTGCSRRCFGRSWKRMPYWDRSGRSGASRARTCRCRQRSPRPWRLGRPRAWSRSDYSRHDRRRACACASCRPSARSHALRRTPSTAKPVFSATRHDAVLPMACSRSSR